MPISPTRNPSPALPPRTSAAQTQTSQAPGNLKETAGKQPGTTQAADASGHVSTPSTSAPQDTFSVSTPSTPAVAMSPAHQARPQATGNVQASAQVQQTENYVLTPDRVAVNKAFINQQQGAMLGRVAKGLKTGTLSPEKLGPVMESAQKLAQATEKTMTKEQVMRSDLENLSQMLVNHEALLSKEIGKPGLSSLFYRPSAAQQALAHQVGELSQEVMQGNIGAGSLSERISNQFGSPAGAGHAASQPPVAGTGDVGATGASHAPAPTLQSMGDMVQQFGRWAGLLGAPAPQTPAPAQASVPAQVQHVGSNLSFPPDATTMSNLSQQHGAMQSKLEKLERLNAGLNQVKITLETLVSLKQGLQQLGDTIKTTSAKERVTSADMFGLSQMVLNNATNIDQAYRLFNQS